jgi:hypothetical protein
MEWQVDGRRLLVFRTGHHGYRDFWIFAMKCPKCGYPIYPRNSSPNGRFYNARYWQNKCEQARRREIPAQRVREPVPYHPQEVYTPVKIKTAYDHRANMRKILSQ